MNQPAPSFSIVGLVRGLLPACLMLVISIGPVGNAAAADPLISDHVYQLRIYRLYDETRDYFHERFRDHAMRIMERHGFDIVSMWEARDDDRTEFIYVLRWPDEETMETRWAAFMADEEWAEIKRRSPDNMVGGIEERTMWLTDYSPPAAGIE